MRNAFLALALAIAAASIQAQTVIYDTFNENDPDDLFDCCNGWFIGGDKSAIKEAEVAVSFTPAQDARITEVDIPLAYLGGTNAIEVEITGSSSRLPGREKHRFLVDDVPPGGQCCVFQALAAGGVLVQGGDTYWVVARAEHDAYFSWNLNTVDIVGRFALIESNGGRWHQRTGTLPAVRIIGR